MAVSCTFTPGTVCVTVTLFLLIAVHCAQSEDCVDKREQKQCDRYREEGRCDRSHEKFEKTAKRCMKTCGICDAKLNVSDLDGKVYFIKNVGKVHEYMTQTERVKRMFGRKKWNRKCVKCLKSSQDINTNQMWKFEEDKENNPGYYFISNVQHSASVNGKDYFESRIMWYYQKRWLKPNEHLVAAFTGPKEDNQLWKVEHYEEDKYIIYPKQEVGWHINLMCLDLRHNLNGGILAHHVKLQKFEQMRHIQEHRVEQINSDCLWKLVPRFTTSEEWQLFPKSYTDNRGISNPSEMQFWLDEGIKLHDETSTSVMVGLESSFETALIGTDNTIKNEITNSMSKGTTSHWQTRSRLIYHAPAGKQFRIMMKTIKFHSIMGKEDDYDFTSQRFHMLLPQETAGDQFPAIEGEIYP